MTLTLGDAPLARHPKVILTELPDGSGVLLHLDTKFYYTLNATGVFVWNELGARPQTRSALAQAITERYAVSLDRAEQDTAALLTDLFAEDLVRPA